MRDKKIKKSLDKISSLGYSDIDDLMYGFTMWESNKHGLRVPTMEELIEEAQSWESQDKDGAFNSALKLPLGGLRDNTIREVETDGYIWGSTQMPLYAVRAQNPQTRASALSYWDGAITTFDYQFTAERPTIPYYYPSWMAMPVRLIKEEPYQGLIGDFVSETIILKGLEYKTVLNTKTKRVWLDRNIGATKVAETQTDSDAYGDLYQWGRAADGHEKRTSELYGDYATTSEPNKGNPWDGKYIKPSVENRIISDIGNEIQTWLHPSNFNYKLWDGIYGENNPALKLEPKYPIDMDLRYMKLRNLKVDKEFIEGAITDTERTKLGHITVGENIDLAEVKKTAYEPAQKAETISTTSNTEFQIDIDELATDRSGALIEPLVFERLQGKYLRPTSIVLPAENAGKYGIKFMTPNDEAYNAADVEFVVRYFVEI